MKNFYALNINQKVINSESCLKLLGVQINNKISFGKHISTLRKKTCFFAECGKMFLKREFIVNFNFKQL